MKRLKKAAHLIVLRLGRSWPVMAAIALFATGVGWTWWTFDWLEISDDERSAYDDGVKKFTGKAWFPWGKRPRSDKLVVVALDDKTFADISAWEPWRQRYGSWPYDRVLYADMFEHIHQCGAKQIIYDAIQDEPKSDVTGDIALGDTIRELGIPYYVGFNVSPKSAPLPKVTATNHPAIKPAPKPSPPDAGAGAGPEEFPSEEFPAEEFPDDGAPEAGKEKEVAAKALAERLAKMAGAYAFPVEVKGDIELPSLPKAQEFDVHGEPTGKELPAHPSRTIDPILDSASGFGLVLHEEDEDGKMRKTRFAYTDGTNTYVTLPVAAAADALGADKVVVEPGKLTIGSRTLHIDRDGSAWIDYPGAFFQQYHTKSMVDVLRLRAARLTALEKEPDPAKRAAVEAETCAPFKDRWVFVAGVAVATGDSKATPLESATPGVAKQIATFESLVWGRFITDAPLWASVLLTFLVCLGSVALVLIVRNPFVDIGWPILLYAGFFLFTGSLLALTHEHVLTAMPSFAGTIASVLATAWERLFSSRERERMKEMFSSYMETELVERMVEQKELPKLDGENIRVTAFFSDIRGFSTFSERLRAEPKSLMRLLNRYLSIVTPELTKHGACIDKYIGDAVVAIFGAPVSYEDHALRACKGALAVQRAIGALREELRKEGLPDVYTRVGINTDSMLVGNIGSEQLLDYTAIGDGMNLAARLEGTNKAYGTLILMGENTFRDTQKHVVAREVDMVRVAGKKVPTRIFELLGLKGEVGGPKLQVAQLYEQALSQFRARQFAEALMTLEKALGVDKEDGPSKVLADRCAKFLKEPPPPTWDGVTEVEK